MQKNLISLPAFKNPKVPNIDQHFGPIDWTWEAATSPSGEASCVTCLAPALPGRPPAVEAGCPCCSWAGLCGRFSEGQVLLPTSQTYPSVPPYLEFVLPFSTLRVLQGLRLFCVRFPLASLLLLHACLPELPLRIPFTISTYFPWEAFPRCLSHGIFAFSTCSPVACG